jgi:hypothetical protein
MIVRLARRNDHKALNLPFRALFFFNGFGGKNSSLNNSYLPKKLLYSRPGRVTNQDNGYLRQLSAGASQVK